jgi:hypothetical protein
MMKRSFMFKITLNVLIVIIAFGFGIPPAFPSTGSIYYSDGPWKGTVIDTETKEPIEGAVVVAVWKKVYGAPAGNISLFLDAIEVLTDKDGRFVIPKFWKFNVLPFIRWFDGPEFEIFKPGYTAFPAYEYFWKYFPHSPLKVDIDTLAEIFKKGVEVELLKLKTKDERLKNIPGLPVDHGSTKLPLYDKLIQDEEDNLGISRPSEIRR